MRDSEPGPPDEPQREGRARINRRTLAIGGRVLRLEISVVRERARRLYPLSLLCREHSVTQMFVDLRAVNPLMRVYRHATGQCIAHGCERDAQGTLPREAKRRQ